MFSSFSFHKIDVTCMEILCDQKAFLRKTSYLFSNKNHFKLKGLIHRKYTRHMLKKNKYGRNRKYLNYKEDQER